MDPTNQMERTLAKAPDVGKSSGPKSILVNVDNTDLMSNYLQSALAIARASRGHLSCLHMTPVQSYVSFDTLGGVFVMENIVEAIETNAKLVRESVEKALKGEDVSWDYREITGMPEHQLVRYSALADLVVVGGDRTSPGGSPLGLIGDLLGQLRTPLFVPGNDGTVCNPNGAALIAWNSSFEAANAVRGSLEMLKLAESVHVIQVSEDADPPFPETRLLEFLSRHGIHAEFRQSPVSAANTEGVVSTILDRAAEVRAEYLVMGGYSHSRVGEYLFGGVTRSLLSNCPLAILVSH
mgnify:CR=1 FL=1